MFFIPFSLTGRFSSVCRNLLMKRKSFSCYGRSRFRYMSVWFTQKLCSHASHGSKNFQKKLVKFSFTCFQSTLWIIQMLRSLKPNERKVFPTVLLVVSLPLGSCVFSPTTFHSMANFAQFAISEWRRGELFFSFSSRAFRVKLVGIINEQPLKAYGHW